MISRSTGAIFSKTYTRWKFHSQTLTETRFWLVCFFRGNPFAALCACMCACWAHFCGKCTCMCMHTAGALSRFSMMCCAVWGYVYICMYLRVLDARKGMCIQWRVIYIHHTFIYERLSPPLIHFYHGIPTGLHGKCGGWKRTILIHLLWKWKTCAHSKLFQTKRECTTKYAREWNFMFMIQNVYNLLPELKMKF